MTEKTTTLQPGNEELVLLIESRREALSARLTDDWSTCLGISDKKVAPLVDTTLTQLMDALGTGLAGRLADPFAEWMSERAEIDGFGPRELLRLTQSLSESLWDMVEEAARAHEDKEAKVIVWLRDLTALVSLTQTTAMDALVTTLEARRRRILDQEQARTARLTQQVRELSSPVIKVWEEVLVLPVVGTIDADRAARMMEDLLQGIVVQQAEIVIIDVTGVPMVDTSVVNYLMQSVQAASFLGARSVLVGINSEMAQSIIQLGIDLSEIETRSNLQAGIEFALQSLHLQIVPQKQVDA